jgi:hypothetical protein
MDETGTPRRARSWARRALIASAAALLLPLSTPLLEAPLEGTGAADAVALLGASPAEAQTVWGVSRRTARRTGRRTARRQSYMRSLPAGYTTTTVRGTEYYVVEGRYYEPKMIEGRVAYVPVEVNP